MSQTNRRQARRVNSVSWQPVVGHDRFVQVRTAYWSLAPNPHIACGVFPPRQSNNMSTPELYASFDPAPELSLHNFKAQAGYQSPTGSK